MGGATRMHDPSEAQHDRTRRRLMNVALIAIALLNLAQWHWVGVAGWLWLHVVLLAVAAVPLGLAVKLFELRFKMSAAERRQLLTELPVCRQYELAVYGILVIIVFVLHAPWLTWALWGVWVYDFFTYYHDRPERMRHLYAAAKILDELREFPRPHLWPIPALVAVIVRMMWTVWN